MPLIYGMTVLLVFQLLGEVGVRSLDIPVPGPVAGMLLLLLALIVRRGVPLALDRSASGLLSHLSLLFVPAGVGLMVADVQDGTLAAALGLKPRDVVTRINGASIRGPGDVPRALGKIDKGEQVVVDFVRRGERRQAKTEKRHAPEADRTVELQPRKAAGERRGSIR